MSDWGRFDDQFRETFDETQDRWRATRAKRKAEGKCWQCAKLIAICTCPNVSRSRTPAIAPINQKSAPAILATQNIAESGPAVTSGFVGADTDLDNNAAPYGNSGREISKRRMKAMSPPFNPAGESHD